MTKEEAVASIKTLCNTCELFPKCVNEKPECFKAIELAISALQVQGVPDTNVGDMISRQAAIDALKGLPTWWADEGGYYGGAQPPMVALLDPEDAVSAIENLPSAQPATSCSEIPNGSTDCISRRAAIDALDMAIERYDEMAEEYQKKADIERNDYMDMRDNAYEAQQLAQWLNELKYLREKIEQITIKPEPHWIPCSNRLPEERGFYLTTTKDKAVYCDYWNEDNFDRTEMVIAWMPLPEPYKEGGEQE